MPRYFLIYCFLAMFAVSEKAVADPVSEIRALLGNGGLYAETSAGNVVLNIRGTERFIPASVLKVLTSFCAIKFLGLDYRFRTEFYLDSMGNLSIKGYGDPSLTSEEIKFIVEQLSSRLREVKNIIVDTSSFAPKIKLDGSANSLNPYDAPNAPLVANFNTALVKRFKAGGVISAEPQTPLTEISRNAGRHVSNSPQRINLGGDEVMSAKYFAELLQAFLAVRGIKSSGKIELGAPAPGARLIYVHNSKPLSEILKGMLEYSTNFTTNQVFLSLGAQLAGYPATPQKARDAISQCLTKFNLQGPVVEEGSGLSRKNKISPQQLVAVLKQFSAYQNLLKFDAGKFRAKTGTLTGVTSYAGYFQSTLGQEIRFAVIINDTLPAERRLQIAEILYRYASAKAK